MHRLRAFFDRVLAFMSAPSRGVLLIGAATAAILLLASIFFQNWYGRTVVAGWIYLREVPLGSAGAALVLALFVTLALAFWDTSPTVEWLEKRFKAPTKADVEAAEGRARQAAKERRDYYWTHYYGVAPDGVSNASPEALADVRRELARFEEQYKALSESLGATTAKEDGLVSEISLGFRQGHSDKDLSFYFAHVFYADVAAPVVRLLDVLRTARESDDPRQVFQAFYAQYCEFREWPARAARWQNHSVKDYGHFAAWAKADEELFEKLKSLPNDGLCTELRAFMASKRRDGWPGPIIDPVEETKWDKAEIAKRTKAAEEAAAKHNAYTEKMIARATARNEGAVRPSAPFAPSVPPRVSLSEEPPQGPRNEEPPST